MSRPLSFRFNTGHLSLDFVTTLRRRPTKRIELLQTDADLGLWVAEAGLWEEPPGVSPTDFADAIALREAIDEVARARLAGLPVSPAAIAVINGRAAEPEASLRLDAAGWRAAKVSPHPLRSALARIARDAIGLLTGPEGRLLKICDQPDCRMLFVDTSPGARRRWCSMDRCGSRAKVAAFRSRRTPRPQETNLQEE